MWYNIIIDGNTSEIPQRLSDKPNRSHRLPPKSTQKGGARMSEDTIRRLFAKVDTISERLARLDTRIEERDRHCRDIAHTIDDLGKRTHDLELAGSQLGGARTFFVWLAATAIALYGILQ